MLPEPLAEWNRTELDYPRDSTIHALFRQQAAATPGQIAVVFQERKLTYCELDERSEKLASYLRQNGVKPESLVGVCLLRSELLVVALLGILKAGCAYVPLDPGHPRERLASVVQDSGVEYVVATNHERAHLGAAADYLKLIDLANIPDEALKSCADTPDVASQNLAYVIYTSGSTGKPKGVMVEHRNVINFFFAMDRVLGRGPGVWLAVTGVAFDISVLELLWTLTRGFTVVMHGDGDAGTFADEIIRNDVTHLQMTPSLARMLMFGERTLPALSGLKQILLGGEAVPSVLVRKIRSVFQGEIFNMYGPTETTIWSTTCRIDLPEVIVPIGRPIANTQIYLLDAQMRPVADADIGEIFIGGDGVARGYWNSPELTAERFLVIPAISAGRIYRTGDLGRMLADGNLEFQGRVDDQIKLRGNRIEPGEIETALEQAPGVRQAVVIARDDKENEPRLVAYIVAERGGADMTSTLRQILADRLPGPMIPSFFEYLSELPLNANGKIDRKALRALSPPWLNIPAVAGHDTAQTELERIVSQIWAEALGVAAIGASDNFFDLGAHSLTIAEVRTKLENALQREVSLIDLFQYSTVASLARHLDPSQSEAAGSRLSDRAARRRLARQA